MRKLYFTTEWETRLAKYKYRLVTVRICSGVRSMADRLNPERKMYLYNRCKIFPPILLCSDILHIGLFLSCKSNNCKEARLSILFLRNTRKDYLGIIIRCIRGVRTFRNVYLTLPEDAIAIVKNAIRHSVIIDCIWLLCKVNLYHVSTL